MKKYSIGIDVVLVGGLLAAIAAPSLAAALPFTGTAAAYPIIDTNTGNAQARADVQTAYNGLLAETCTTDMTHVDMNNQRLLPGTYCFSSGTILNGQVLLDAQGNPNAVFVFKMNSRFDVWPNATVVLLGGARAENVFWQVGGTVSIGVNAQFSGTIIAMNSIVVGGGVASSVFDDRGTVNGRLWSVGSTVSVPPRAVIGLFQPAPLPYSYVAPTYVTPPAPAYGYLTISSNDSNFALFVNGARVISGQRYSFAPGAYAVTEVNLSGVNYGAPSFSGACSQNGLSGAVSLNAGDEKNCVISNSYAYTNQQYQPAYQSACATGCQPACGGGCVPNCANGCACNGGCQPGLPNTGFGGSYLPIMNMLGIMILTAFVWQETRSARASA